MNKQQRAGCTTLFSAFLLAACTGGVPGDAAIDGSSRSTASRGDDGLIAPARPREAGALRVMTWNVRYASSRENYEDWPTRRPDLAELLAASDTDILGVQEMVAEKEGHRQLDDIHAMLPGYAYIGRSRSATNPDDEQSGVFYKPEALEELRSGFFWLSPAPSTPGSFGYGNQGNPRMATWVHFRNRSDDAEFVLVNTHFDHRSAEARYRSADQIAGYRTGDPAYANDGVDIDPNLPMVLIGDFNFNRHQNEQWVPEGYEGETYDPLKAARIPLLFGLIPTQMSQQDPGVFPMAGNLSPYNRLVTNGPFLDALDVAEVTVAEPIGSFNGFAELRAGVIDWVLVTPDVRVLQSYMETYRPQGNYPSDHLPIVADVLILD